MRVETGSADVSPQLTLVAMKLRGGNTPDSRVKSVVAYGEFKMENGFYQVSQISYTDNDGYAMFCLVVLVTDTRYVSQMFLQSWERVCTKIGITGSGSEVAFGYDSYLSFALTLTDALQPREGGI